LTLGTTPTTVRKTVLSVMARRSSGFCGEYMRRPIGSWPGQNRWASFSSMMSTGWLPSVSFSSKARPLTILMPMVSK
jgi:hypothetical protein